MKYSKLQGAAISHKIFLESLFNFLRVCEEIIRYYLLSFLSPSACRVYFFLFPKLGQGTFPLPSVMWGSAGRGGGEMCTERETCQVLWVSLFAASLGVSRNGLPLLFQGRLAVMTAKNNYSFLNLNAERWVSSLLKQVFNATSIHTLS